MSATDTVWTDRRYESGVYDVAVERVGDTGRLSVTLVGAISYEIHRESVKLDRADIDAWQKRAVAVITNPDLRAIE